jgi:ADP-ribose pyrophosphatase
MEEKISSRLVHKGWVVNLRVDTVRRPDGRETTRDVVEHNAVIVVVALDEAACILLVRQYRYAVGKVLLELPAGGIDPGETLEQAVCREMQEETGFLPRKIIPLGGFYSAPGFCTEYLHLFLVSDLVPGRLHAEDTDEITLVRMTIDDIMPLVRSGAIEDAKTMAGLLAFLEYQHGHG